MKTPKKTLNSTDRKYLLRAISTAESSRGKCSPNPFVGAVIVQGDTIVGTGSTQTYGSDHAEVVALKEAGDNAHGATMYVTLEPCCHFGKTPPCTKAIIAAEIKRVVIGILDPNPLVAGKGVKELRDAGIEVQHGFFTSEITEQLQYYLCYMQKQRPFVIWKTALTLDGKYAAEDGSSQWITNEKARRLVHKMRSEVEVVLSGAKSVMDDDAMLNSRYRKGCKQPLRVVLDPLLDITVSSKLVQSASEYPTLIFHHIADLAKEAQLRAHNVELKRIYGREDTVDLHEVMAELHKRKLYSILLETGNALSEAFWKAKLVDKCYIFYGNKILGGQKSALGNLGLSNIYDSIELKNIKIRRIEENFLVIGYPERWL